MLIHERFKELRKYLKMTQTEFGEQLGKTMRTIQEYERANRAITDGVLLNLQEKFNVNIDWMRTGQGSMFLSEKKEEKENKNKRYEFLNRMLDEFSDEELAEIIKTTQAALDKKNNKIENAG